MLSMADLFDLTEKAYKRGYVDALHDFVDSFKERATEDDDWLCVRIGDVEEIEAVLKQEGWQ